MTNGAEMVHDFEKGIEIKPKKVRARSFLDGQSGAHYGAFSGPLSGEGTIRMTLTGSRSSGAYSQKVPVSGQTAADLAIIARDMELSCGSISMKMRELLFRRINSFQSTTQ